jgi:hypothetical protein
MKDFIAPIPINISNCGTVIIHKHTDPRGVNQDFPIGSNVPDNVPSGSTDAGCREAVSGYTSPYNLNDNLNTTGDNSANTDTCTFVPAGGPYTVAENSVPSGFTFESLSCLPEDPGGSTNTITGQSVAITVVPGGVTECTFVNKQNTATLATQVSDAGPVFPSTAVHDTATVTGNIAADTPSGTVTFFLCGPIATGSCGSGGTNIGTGTLSGSGSTASATSPDVNTSASPLTPGRYCFRAEWPGDTNYPTALTHFGGANGTNECFTIRTITTTTTTTPSVGSGGTTTFGSSVTDHAVVQAVTSGDGTPTGTVTFFICDPTQVLAGACLTGGTQVGNPVDTQAVSPATIPPSSFADSIGKTVDKTGTWCWRAVYTPGGANGGNYTGSSDGTSGECFTVTDTTASTSAQTWRPNDTGTITSANGAPLTGTLSIQLYTGDNCGATSGSAVSGQLYTTTLSGAASPQSLTTNNTTFAVSTSSSVSWLVTFTSTNTNVTGSSHCESTSLTITN